MGVPKSLLTSPNRIAVERASRAHNCKRSRTHRIHAGDIRLRVPNGRSQQYYCVVCAKVSIEKDIELLQRLERELGA